MAKTVAKLDAKGWTRQNVACEPRLSEAVTEYERLGFEVRVIDALELGVEDVSGGKCTDCIEGDPDPSRYKVIFTRPSGEEKEDELF